VDNDAVTDQINRRPDDHCAFYGYYDIDCQKRTTHGVGLTYKGTVNKTVSGKTCQMWNANTPQYNYFLDRKWNHNHCRNPDNTEKGVWCYTTKKGVRWEYCDVRECSDCDGPADCGLLDFNCQKRTEEGLGLTYEGNEITTITGKDCQAWNVDDPQYSNFKDLGWTHNHCRNPDNETGGVWCYTTVKGSRWEHCDVRECEDCDLDTLPKAIPPYTGPQNEECSLGDVKPPGPPVVGDGEDYSQLSKPVPNTTSSQDYNLVQFDEMVIHMNNCGDLSSLPLDNHGLFCGSADGPPGSRVPIDKLDQCCCNHDHCYNKIMEGRCKDEEGIRITYTWQDNMMECRDHYDTCARAICDCDKHMAMCVANVLAKGAKCPKKITIGQALQAVKRMMK